MTKRINWWTIREATAFIAHLCLYITYGIFFGFVFMLHSFLFSHGSLSILNQPIWFYIMLAIPPTYFVLWFIFATIDLLLLKRKAQHE